MNNATPPGWYPVPGPDGAPGHERWWDGTAWTNDVRPVQGGSYGYPGLEAHSGPPAYPAQQPYPAHQAYPAYPAQPQPYLAVDHGHPGPGYPPVAPAPQRVKPGVVIAVAVAVLAVGGGVAGLALSHGGDPVADPTTDPTVSVSRSTEPTTSPSPTPTPAPKPSTPKPAPVLRTTVADQQHSITLPVFEGWEVAAKDTPQWSVYLGSGRYTCANGKACIRGRFSVEKNTIQGDTPKAAADAAMPAVAKQIFSGMTSQTDYGSGSLAVAGVAGYATRWHITNADGTQGYVLLAALPAKGGGYVVFDGGVDDDPAAPDVSVLDQILLGVKKDDAPTAGT
ncbi:DUF2510 domain-containing protein [Kitasatospora sp. NPDC048298]|uniref:DUF2510 domain-containing protein n=1 Tax=Kitasatospora sp. NPDC048298 TaxID=3364049 RepID=UPI00370FD588